MQLEGLLEFDHRAKEVGATKGFLPTCLAVVLGRFVPLRDD